MFLLTVFLTSAVFMKVFVAVFLFDQKGYLI